LWFQRWSSTFAAAIATPSHFAEMSESPKLSMPMLLLNVVRFVEEHQPNIVECELIDASGRSHLFIEKSAIVSDTEFWPTSAYPCPGSVACEVEEELQDPTGNLLLRVNTARPWSVESTMGETVFVVKASQVTR